MKSGKHLHRIDKKLTKRNELYIITIDNCRTLQMVEGV